MIQVHSRHAANIFAVAFVGVLALMSARQSLGAQDGKTAEKNKPDAAPPAREDVTLQTGDGVQLDVSFYPGSRGSETIPVVLLHAWKGKGADFRDFAIYLQKTYGFAVVVPDLRGHGGSTTRKTGGKTETLAAANFAPRDFQAIVDNDLISVKDYLKQKNNAEKVNLNKLCLIGAEMGASLAVLFADLDAQGYMEGTPPGSTTYGSVQVGGFVKALALLSPEWSFKGLNLKSALDNPAIGRDMPMLILVGADNSRSLSEAKKIESYVEKLHVKDKSSLVFSGNSLKTIKQGAGLLDLSEMKDEAKTEPAAPGKAATRQIVRVKDFYVQRQIGTFIDSRFGKGDDAKALAWKRLLRPHEKSE